MKKDSVNFTDDLIEGYCTESNIDKKLMVDMYEHYVEKIKDKTKNPKTIEIPINGFGVFFLPLHGAIIDVTAKEKAFAKGNTPKEELDFFVTRKDTVKQKIEKCKDCGIKNIKFLHTLIKREIVKNSE